MRLLIILFILFIASCASGSLSKPLKTVDNELKISPIFKNAFIGVSVYDIENDEFIYDYNADRYFTPASNTKLLTFFTALRLLPDSIPALHYKILNDSLVFWGTADPTFLSPDTLQSITFDFLKNRSEKLFFSSNNYSSNQYGVGWMWDDYNSSYQPELSSFPIYNNFVRFELDSNRQFSISPPYFQSRAIRDTTLQTSSMRVERELLTNLFHYNYSDTAYDEIRYRPFIVSDSLTVRLLSDTLKKPIYFTNSIQNDSSKTLYAYSTDTLLKRMLQPSDNFFAESLLLMSSEAIFDKMNSDSIILYSKDSLLSYIMSQEPNWVDGSGLSRYNIFTPKSLVELLHYFYQTYDEYRLFELLAIGGVNGTIQNRFTDFPYSVFGKTGSLSNNHNLSGYLLCKSGKKLIFSFMANHFMVSTTQIRKEMDRLITILYNTY